jgi:hypothetical protein
VLKRIPGDSLPGVVIVENVGTTLLCHIASEAEALPKLGEAGHSTFDTVGHVITGAVLSDTEMVRAASRRIAAIISSCPGTVLKRISGDSLPGVVNGRECRSYVIVASIRKLKLSRSWVKQGINVRYARTGNHRSCIIIQRWYGCK